MLGSVESVSPSSNAVGIWEQHSAAPRQVVAYCSAVARPSGENLRVDVGEKEKELTSGCFVVNPEHKGVDFIELT